MFLLVDRNAIERCAPSGPQKHITKESEGFHNHSNRLAMVKVFMQLLFFISFSFLFPLIDSFISFPTSPSCNLIP